MEISGGSSPSRCHLAIVLFQCLRAHYTCNKPGKSIGRESAAHSGHAPRSLDFFTSKGMITSFPSLFILPFFCPCNLILMEEKKKEKKSLAFELGSYTLDTPLTASYSCLKCPKTRYYSGCFSNVSTLGKPFAQRAFM